MNMCTGTFRRSLPIMAVTAMCTTGIASLTYGETIERPDDIRAPKIGDLVEPGGIAGVAFSENFESGYTLGFGCGQNLWACGAGTGGFDIVNFPAQVTFGAFSYQSRAGAGGTAGTGGASPIFASQTGQTHADIVISDNASLFQWNSVNTIAGFFNTRLNFEANGQIRALTVDPACTVGTFANTTGTWAPNVKMRIGIEVLAGNILRVYKNGAVIFTGQDIAQICAAATPAGITRVQNFNSNTGTTTLMTVDNISQDAVLNPCSFPLPFCRSDVFPVGGNGQVNIDDLLAVINTWGQTQNPPGTGPRPQGDTTPLPNGNCLVNIDDLLTVINAWGTCPVPSGACCIQGVCSIQTQTACTGSPNFGTYQGTGTTCAGVNCPIPPANDLCANAATAVNGSNAWNNANANNDGGPVDVSCLPDGGGGRQDVWFRYTATCTGNVTFDTTGTAAPFTDTILQIFDSWNCNPLGQLLGCNDDIDFAGNNFLSRAVVQVNANQQVLVRCLSQTASPASNSGPAVLNIACAPLNNALCTQAATVVPGVAVTGTVQGAQAPTAPNCLPSGINGFGRWYRFNTGGSDLNYTASTCNSPLQFSWNGRLAVYCGLNCSDMTCVTGNATFNCGPAGTQGSGTQERVTWCGKANKTYFIYVGAESIPAPPNGAYELLVTAGAGCDGSALTCGLAPANNACADAIVINNGTRTFSTEFATTDGPINTGLPTGVTCSDSGGTNTVNDIWYRYTATCNGELLVTTCSQLGGNSNYDSDIVLYPGNSPCPPLASTTIACNDDDSANPCGSAPPWSSSMRAQVTNGTSYLLRVGGWQNSTDFGTGVLNVSCTPAVCGNGIIEGSEQCDDGNNNPGDGCFNCMVEANCAGACTVSPPEVCVTGTDTTNGGCNTTPTMYQNVALTGGTAVVCGTLSTAVVGTTDTRDLDWYTVTVGASGRLEAHITGTSLMPLLVFVATTTPPPANGTVCTTTVIRDSVTVTQGNCAVAAATGLTPGSLALVIPTTSVFTGFPCPGPWDYKVRIVSP
jgi:cysteine-rich repeat protein